MLGISDRRFVRRCNNTQWHNHNESVWAILDLQHRKLFRRTEKYASKGFLVAHPNLPQTYPL